MKYTELVEELQAIRKLELERSRDWVARKVGVSSHTFQWWELGYRSLTIDKLHSWASVLGYELVITLKKK